MTTRDDFEEWLDKRWIDISGNFFEKDEDGEYTDNEVCLAWKAWQAATAKQQARIDQCERLLNDSLRLGDLYKQKITNIENKIEQLRQALREIKEHDEARMYASCPDCDYEGVCEKTRICKGMPHSKVGEIAAKAMDESNDN